MAAFTMSSQNFQGIVSTIENILWCQRKELDIIIQTELSSYVKPERGYTIVLSLVKIVRGVGFIIK